MKADDKRIVWQNFSTHLLASFSTAMNQNTARCKANNNCYTISIIVGFHLFATIVPRPSLK